MASKVIFNLEQTATNFIFNSNILSEKEATEIKIDLLKDSIESLKYLQPDCDFVDYSIAISSGLLMGIMDIFIVGNHKKGNLLDKTDKWIEGRVKDFSRLCGWDGLGDASKAITFLENKFKVPYDQRGAGDSGEIIKGMTPSNHHFKSLAHQPNLVGVFFSILDQIKNQSHFVSDGRLILLSEASNTFTLKGNDIVSAIFFGTIQWFGHLVSDSSGSSSSKGRGMGIPSPIWSWTNNIIVLKDKLNIPISDFDNMISDLALKMFEKGYDARVHVAEAVPVIINELVVRFFYSLRRSLKYFQEDCNEYYSFKLLWDEIRPYDNPSVKRMLTVAHGSFCLLDIGDVLIRNKNGNPAEVMMRLNIIGLGRFTVSLYGEGYRYIKGKSIENNNFIMQRESIILEYYLSGLTKLSVLYDDEYSKLLIRDFTDSEIYKEVYSESIKLAKLRSVPEDKILMSKEQGDAYFKGDI